MEFALIQRTEYQLVKWTYLKLLNINFQSISGGKSSKC